MTPFASFSAGIEFDLATARPQPEAVGAVWVMDETPFRRNGGRKEAGPEQWAKREVIDKVERTKRLVVLGECGGLRHPILRECEGLRVPRPAQCPSSRGGGCKRNAGPGRGCGRVQRWTFVRRCRIETSQNALRGRSPRTWEQCRSHDTRPIRHVAFEKEGSEDVYPQPQNGSSSQSCGSVFRQRSGFGAGRCSQKDFDAGCCFWCPLRIRLSGSWSGRARSRFCS